MSVAFYPPTGLTVAVTSINTLTGDVVLAAGSGITLTPSGQTITISAAGGGITFPIDAPNGAPGAPSYSFTSNTAVGMLYASGLMLSSDGTLPIKFDALGTGVQFAEFIIQDGVTVLRLPAKSSSTHPNLTSIGNTTTGINFTGDLEFMVAAQNQLTIGTNGGSRGFFELDTDLAWGGGNLYNFGCEQNGTNFILLPPLNSYFGTGGLQIGTYTVNASAPLVAPLDLLDVRGGAGVSRTRYTNTATTSTGAHGSTVGIDASGNMLVQQLEALALTIDGVNGVTIGATSTTTQHKLNTATSAPAAGALTLLNGPTDTSGNPTGYVSIVVNGTSRVIPFW